MFRKKRKIEAIILDNGEYLKSTPVGTLKKGQDFLYERPVYIKELYRGKAYLVSTFDSHKKGGWVTFGEPIKINHQEIVFANAIKRVIYK